MNPLILSKLLSGTLFVSFGTLSTMVFGFLSTAIAARSLAAEAFGTFVLLRVVGALLSRITSFGMEGALPRFLVSLPEAKAKTNLIATAWYFRVVVVLITGLFVFAFHRPIERLFGSWGQQDFLVLTLAIYLMEAICRFLDAAMEGLLHFKLIGVVKFISSLANLLLILLLVVSTEFGIGGLVLALVISHLLGYALAYLHLPLHKGANVDWPNLRKLLKFGLPLQVNDILNLIFLRVDTILIGILMGSSQIAFYEIARKIPESITGVYQAFRSAYFPLVSRLHASGDTEGTSSMINHSTRLISFITISAALVSLLFGHEIISFAFSDKYLPSFPVFVLLMIGVNLTLVEYTFGWSLVAIGESDKPLIVNIIRSGLNIIGNALFIPWMGVIGAALANVIGNSFTSSLDVFYLRKSRIDARSVYFIKPLLVYAIIATVYILVASDMLIVKVSFFLCFLLLCLVLSIVTTKDINTLYSESRRMLRKPSFGANG